MNHQVFNAQSIPLNGVHLLEAGAGTGKTHAITQLYLRLLLERSLTPPQILVVTFTQAATGELRERIRQTLQDHIHHFDSGNPAETLPQDSVIRPWVIDSESAEKCRRHLQSALTSFDESSVYTIHGFCRSVLQENAFEAGVTFNAELLPNETSLRLEAFQDSWRRIVYPMPRFYQDFLSESKITLNSLIKKLSPLLEYPIQSIEPDSEIPITALENRWRELRQFWREHRDAIREFMLNLDNIINDRDFKKNPLFYINSLENAFQTDYGYMICLTEITKKVFNKNINQHPEIIEFIKLAKTFIDELQLSLPIFKAFFFQDIQQCLERRKRSLNQQSFKDLLTLVADALTDSARGGILTDSLRHSYRAALIDEFQDTDITQYTIFHTIFAHEGHSLFLIGDPKQSIYRFRGADLSVYLKARDESHDCRFLETNWRSTPELVQALNALFSDHPNPFGDIDIQYHTLSSPPHNELKLMLDPEIAAPLVIRHHEGNTIFNNKSNTNSIITRSLLSEISRILWRLPGKPGITLDGKPIQPQDIAILVNNHFQASLMKQAINQLGIPVATLQRDSVFNSLEAWELLLFLKAVHNPHFQPTVKAVCLTHLLGYRPAEIHSENQITFDLLQKFSRYHQLWLKYGLLRMFQTFREDTKLDQRLWGYPDGDRKITNFNHLIDYLNTIDYHKTNDPGYIIQEMQSLIEAESGSVETELRLEKDGNAIQIITIHKAKGLQYNIVFCPFLWNVPNSDKAATELSEYSTRINFNPSVDLQLKKNKDNKESATPDPELLRLFYVAVTRARYRCYIDWPEGYTPRNGKVESFSTHYFFHNRQQKLSEHASIAWQTLTFTGWTPATEAQSAKCENISFKPELAFAASLAPAWRMSSFSGMTQRLHETRPDFTDWETEETLTENPPETTLPTDESAFPLNTLPGGAQTGNLVHALFEQLNFSRPEPRRLIPSLYYQYPLSPQLPLDTLSDILVKLVETTLSVPLRHSRGKLTLNQLDDAQTLKELQFCFPIADFDSRALNTLLKFPIGEITVDSLTGFIQGYIDLVFEWQGRYFVLDWKTNNLGTQTGNYTPDKLHAAMDRSGYYLQGYLYTLALHQHLSHTLADYQPHRHLGGIYYLFLRGIEKDKENGIFYYQIEPDDLITCSQRYIHSSNLLISN